jgi:endonuclease G
MRKKWELVLSIALRKARNHPNVIGVDYGYVYKSDVRLQTLGVRFHVAGKLPLSELPPREVLPNKIETTRCDVVVARYSLHGGPQTFCDPIQPGISVGHLKSRATGTLGMLVKDPRNNKPALLSNWHVLCGSPDALPGDEICQPGVDDSGTLFPKVVARLERSARLDTGTDAAIALIADGIALDQTLFDQAVKIQGIEAPRPGMKVFKYGARSQLTHGLVESINGTFELDYAAYGDQKRWIDSLRIIPDPDFHETEIALAGDSGSVWINSATNKAVALHFAGEDGAGPTAEYSLAQPMPRVFSMLDIELLA